MCGRDVEDIFAVDFNPGVIVSTSENIEKEFEQGFGEEDISSLPSK